MSNKRIINLDSYDMLYAFTNNSVTLIDDGTTTYKVKMNNAIDSILEGIWDNTTPNLINVINYVIGMFNLTTFDNTRVSYGSFGPFYGESYIKGEITYYDSPSGVYNTNLIIKDNDIMEIGLFNSSEFNNFGILRNTVIDNKFIDLAILEVNIILKLARLQTVYDPVSNPTPVVLDEPKFRGQYILDDKIYLKPQPDSSTSSFSDNVPNSSIAPFTLTFNQSNPTYRSNFIPDQRLLVNFVNNLRQIRYRTNDTTLRDELKMNRPIGFYSYTLEPNPDDIYRNNYMGPYLDFIYGIEGKSPVPFQHDVYLKIDFQQSKLYNSGQGTRNNNNDLDAEIPSESHIGLFEFDIANKYVFEQIKYFITVKEV